MLCDVSRLINRALGGPNVMICADAHWRKPRLERWLDAAALIVFFEPHHCQNSAVFEEMEFGKSTDPRRQ